MEVWGEGKKNKKMWQEKKEYEKRLSEMTQRI